MYYITLQPYNKKQTKPDKVDEKEVLLYLKKLVLLSPHKLTVLSQERSGIDHKPVVNDDADLVYSYKKHGFIVPFEILDDVSRHV